MIKLTKYCPEMGIGYVPMHGDNYMGISRFNHQLDTGYIPYDPKLRSLAAIISRSMAF